MTTRRRLAAAAIAILGLLPGCGPRRLSDADLVAFAASNYDAKAMEGKHLVLGVHRTVAVVVDFPCFDLCPAYTTRIIHYDLPADASCAAKGGVTVLIGTPVGVGEFPIPYCVPKVLADNPQMRRGL